MATTKRVVEIKSPKFSEKAQLIYYSDTPDSEALHQLLCEFDPGENYTVTFSNYED